MKSFQILLELDKILCKLLGFSSPWYTNKEYCLKYNLYKFFLYFIQQVILFLITITTFVYQLRTNDIHSYLIVVAYTLIIIEEFLNICFFGLCKNRIDRFSVALRTNQSRLHAHFGHVRARNLFLKTFLLLFLLLVGTFFYVFMIQLVSQLYLVLTVFRCLVIAEISLQWSVCMENIETDLSKVRKLLKSAATPSDGKTGVLEAAVRAYRIVADNYRIVDDYYGTYNLFGTSLVVLRAVKNPYLIWHCLATNCDCKMGCCGVRFIILVLFTTWIFIIFTMKTLICFCVERKVRITLYFVHIIRARALTHAHTYRHTGKYPNSSPTHKYILRVH